MLRGDFIALEETLVHPSLDEPCAFVSGVRLAPLLRQFEDGRSVAEVLQGWAGQLAPDTAEALLSWLWEADLIAPVAEAG